MRCVMTGGRGKPRDPEQPAKKKPEPGKNGKRT